MKPGTQVCYWCLYWFVLGTANLVNAADPDWGYYNVPATEGPDSWKVNFPSCGGTRQSPVHIYSNEVTVKDELGDLKLTGYDEVLTNYTFKMTNNGHTIVFAVDTDDPTPVPVHIEDGGLDGIYHLAQFHMHWGSGNDNGSEHWVDDVHYAAEIHLVHLHDKIGHFSEAHSIPKAIAVLGIILEVSGEDNPNFEDIVSHVPNVAYKDSPPYPLKPFPLRQLLPEKDAHKFYRYEGSLTNPPCSEVVVWSVFERTVPISQRQIDVLRKELHHMTKAESGTHRDYRLFDNHRLPQPLNGRKVYVNTIRDEISPADNLVSNTLLLTLLAATAMMTGW